jgi:putative tricarboxylic transport membrane protein
MEVLQNLLIGFSVANQPVNLLFCFVGVLMGTLVGVLPGLGPAGAMAMLLPLTYHMPLTAAIIMMAGIYYGAIYGGAITSILMNIPGEANTVVTCLDGHPMAKQGRAGPALGISAFGAFIAGTFGLIAVTIVARPLASVALQFGSPEYFGLCFLGLTFAIFISSSAIKAFVTAAFGLILSSVGIDTIEGSPRFTFDLIQLWDGIDLVTVAMGLFGVAEVLEGIEQTGMPATASKIQSFLPTLKDWMRAKGAIIRGTLVGFLIGILPGGHPATASFLSYGLEKRIAKEPERFGNGAIEGVAGPESASNAASAGGFIPLFLLGIPSNVVLALIFGTLMIHGMRPGPQTLIANPDLFWGVICSMYLGNVMLLILNIPLIPMWVKVLKVPNSVLFPLILLFCIIGAYSLKNSSFDVLMMMLFGLLGYAFRKFGYEAAPLILAFVLGPMVETSLRQSLLLSRGSILIFFTRPISAILLSIVILLIILAIVPNLKKSPKVRVKEPQEGTARIDPF